MALNKPRDNAFARRPGSPSLRGPKRCSNLLNTGRPMKMLRLALDGSARPLAKMSLLICSVFLALCFLASQAAATTQEGVYKSTLPPKPKAAEPQTVSAEPAKSEVKSFAYDPIGKPDPFKSFILEQEEMAEKVKRKPRTYLETLDLSQLELIAIVTGPQGSYAMVRDSKGVGHVIIKGTAVGTNGGVVDRITDREVIIREEYRDFRGSTQFKDVSKKLPSLM